MTDKRIKNELYRLMTDSKAMASLDPEKRLAMQDKILALPSGKIMNVITILKREKKDFDQTQKQLDAQGRELKNLMKAAQSLNAACRNLEKLFLQTRESAEKNETSKITDSLLNRIDQL
jgi:hypothetical protein